MNNEEGREAKSDEDNSMHDHDDITEQDPETYKVPTKKHKKETEVKLDKSVDVNNEEGMETKSDQENNIQEKIDITKQDKRTHDNEDPIPSTSGSNEKDRPNIEKRYKKSLLLLQYEWCQQQPDFIKLKSELLNKYK